MQQKRNQIAQEEGAAATKLQAIKRGRDSRQVVKDRRAGEAAQAAAAEEAREAAAKVQLGACAKGYVARKQIKKDREMASATTRIAANYRGKKERADPTSEANVRRATRDHRAANDPGMQAERYIQEHKILQLFELLGEQLVRQRPQDPRAFLVGVLEQLKDAADPTSPLNTFGEEDIDTLYNMYDASSLGLTPAQCREALNAVGLEKVGVPAAVERFDKPTFLSLVKGA